MKSISAAAVALSILAGLCSADTSSIPTTPDVVQSSVAVPGPETKKARRKIKPPSSLDPIKIGDPVLARKLMEKARRIQNNGNNYGGYSNYNKQNANYAYNAGANGNYYAAAKYNQAQYNNNKANGQNYNNYYAQNDYNSNANQNQYWNQDGFEEWYLTQSQWLKDFSVKFQGCHHITEWNKEAVEAADIRVNLKRLVRFRMCPTAYCNAAQQQGCSDGYGEYVIDLDTFLEAYVEGKEEYDQNMEQYNNQDGQQYYYNGQYNQQQQEDGEEDQEANQNQAANYYGDRYGEGYSNGYNWYQQQNWDDNGLDIADYLECQQLDMDYQAEGYYAQQQEDEDWDGSYYMGPTCGSQGGSIQMGIFKDEDCTISVDSSDNGANLYYLATGFQLPFSQSNMIELDCIPCSEVQMNNNNDGNNNNNNNGDYNQQNDNEVSDWCEQLYMVSGKCEESLPYGTTVSPNNQACNYVEGVKVLRQDGTILTTNRSAPGGVSRGNKTAAAFIGLFTAATVLLTAYSYYLKTKLDRASIALLE